LAAILDVVYNHLGPDGNYLPKFSEKYFSTENKTDWGAAINFDGELSGPVREFYIANAAYWISEFHLDGLRLDSTQDIYDKSARHILLEINRSARRAAEPRGIILIGENEPQNTKLLGPESAGGYELDALWNDDFHHSAMVAATGRRDAYYTDYLGTAQELLSAMKYGFLFQGQMYSWQKKRRGTPAMNLQPPRTVAFVQNHDQIANSARGARLHELTTFGRYKALTALILLGPSTPMLFQGQEFAASTPFLYFADQKPEIARLVREGRREFLGQWRSLRIAGIEYADPAARATFEQCKLKLSERDSHTEIYELHRDLLKLRKTEPLLARQGRQFDGAVLAPEAFVIRFFSENYLEDLLLAVNLGVELNFNPSPEPLLGPPQSLEWSILWSTEDPRYGGNGTAPLDSENNWIIPGHAAVLLEAKPASPKQNQTK
jgi:maltooligosyltrehalose trehalohydrolase